jgi:GNAT superfamily N-acetyltransferase
MAPSEALAIERLGRADVAAGLALSDAAAWNQSADDWAFFLAHGDVRGLRDEAGTLIATAAALPYDAATGWISMVLVAVAHRHRGLASRLVAACVESLREHGRTPVLDATPAGAAVYAKSGFREGFAFERWQGEGAGASQARAEGLAVATGADAASLIACDRAASGVDRAALWRAFLARPATRAWHGARGMALCRAGRRASQVGPIVADDEAAALDLLALALDGVAGPVFIDVPVHCVALAGALAQRGFVRQRSFVRMALGDARASAARERVFALAGPEFG